MDCSSCVGAAGKSDQTTYQAQMLAYGNYKNNCTVLTGGKGGVSLFQQFSSTTATIS
jgi:hypothetical protein